MIGPHIKFAIENITLQQINDLYKLLNGKSSNSNESTKKMNEKACKKLEDFDKGGKKNNQAVLGKRQYQEDDIDALCNGEAFAPVQKAHKLDPVMVSYIEWVAPSDSTKESNQNNGESSHNSYSIPNCHEIDYNWKVDAILKSAQ